MWLLCDNNLKVTRHAIVTTSTSPTLKIEYHTLLKTCWEVNLLNALTWNNTLTMTMRTLVLNHRTFAVTLWALALCLHHTKD